jgi:hypothetical protein
MNDQELKQFRLKVKETEDRFRLVFESVGRNFFLEEINSDFPHLKLIRSKNLQRLLSWIEALDVTKKKDFIKNLDNGLQLSAIWKECRSLNGVVLRFKFEERRLFLAKFKKEYKHLKFKKSDSSDVIIADSEIGGKIRVRTFIFAHGMNRLNNIHCSHSIGYVKDPYNVMPQVSLSSFSRLFPYDAWSTANLDVNTSYEEVVKVMEKSYELIEQMAAIL